MSSVSHDARGQMRHLTPKSGMPKMTPYRDMPRAEPDVEDVLKVTFELRRSRKQAEFMQNSPKIS